MEIACVHAIAALAQAEQPKKKRTSPAQFFKEVRAEARKITWTTRKETWITSVMVGIMVVIAAVDGYRLEARPVPLHARRHGTSKFNWRRIPVGVVDLLSVWFQVRFGRKPFRAAGAL